MCRGELGGEHHVTVRVDGADLPEAAGLDGQAVGQLAAALVEGQQAHAVAIRGADEASVRAETQLFDVAPADVGLLDVVGEAEGAAGGDQRAGGGSLLELIHTCPLRRDRTDGGDAGLDHTLRSETGLLLVIFQDFSSEDLAGVMDRDHA